MNLEKYIEDTFSGLSYGKYLLLNSFYESIHMTQSWYNKENVENRYRFNENKLFYKIKHLIKLSNLGQFLILKRNTNRQSEEFMTQSYVFATIAE